jgi:hypothetical protein
VEAGEFASGGSEGGEIGGEGDARKHWAFSKAKSRDRIALDIRVPYGLRLPKPGTAMAWPSAMFGH